MFLKVVAPPSNNKDTITQLYLCVQTHIYAYIDKPKIGLIKNENSTNLATLNYENLKHMAFLKHVEHKLRVEAGKNEL
jgi:hypothetical protein